MPGVLQAVPMTASGHLITDPGEAAAACARLAAADYITVDTEFMRESTYWPVLCLVQLAGPDEAVAIDPLAPGMDLQPLYDLLADPKVLKAFHAARQDVEIFHHQAGQVPTPLFDTQVAAMVCGFGDSVGYEALVTKLAKARIDKSSRFTDWSRRPLTDRQITYALADVIHLRPVYEALRAMLVKSGREHWLEEEMAVLTNPATYETQPEDSWQRLKPRTTDPKFLAVLREVAAWREIEAQKRDLPRGRLLRDDAVMEIAAHAPKSVDELARTRGLSKAMAEGWQGAGLLQAVERGLAVPRDQRPQMAARQPLPNGVGPLIELLKVLLKAKCDDHGVAGKLVASSADLERIATETAPDIPALHGWRRELFGEDALALKAGRLALAADGRRVRLIPIDPAG